MTLCANKLACVRGGRELFHGIEFELTNGDALKISGSNGSGKTSLLRSLCGLIIPNEGDVKWNGVCIRQMREEYSRQILYLGHSNGLKDDLMSWENVAVSATLSGVSISREQAYESLDQCGLSSIADLPVRVLSQGQRKRVALAKLYIDKPKQLWILDEPFSALDQDAINVLSERIRRHLDLGGILIYTTHQAVSLNAKRNLNLDLDSNFIW